MSKEITIQNFLLDYKNKEQVINKYSDYKIIYMSLRNNKGENIFMFFARKGDLKVLQFLLDKCSDNFRPEEIDNEGENIFMISAKEGKLDILQFLLSKYSDNFKPEEINNEGENIFMISAKEGKLDILKYLKHTYIKKFQSMVNEQNKENYTALNLVLCYLDDNENTRAIIHELLDTDPNIPNKDGMITVDFKFIKI